MAKMKLQVQCRMCKATKCIEVDRSAYNKWRGGELIQRCFPHLSPGDRELLISGTCGPCFNKLFGGDS